MGWVPALRLGQEVLGSSSQADDGREMMSAVSRADTQITRSPVVVCGKRNRGRWGKERIRDLGHLRASVVRMPSSGKGPPCAQSPLRGLENRTGLGPFSRTSRGGQHGKRRCRSLASFHPCVGIPIPALLRLPPLPVPVSPRSTQAMPGWQSLWQGGALGMKLLSWLAARVFALPWPCLLTRGPSYLPGVNAWGRENKPPLAAPAPLAASWGGSGQWQWGQWQVGPSSLAHAAPAHGDQAVLRRGWDRPGTWQAWGGRMTQEQFPPPAEAHP